ncbi:PEP/pyruvate-binding domain-containing protein [Paenibacillus spongiae]|uniref:Pyruvate phosphate dikinase AMP/ATP-binding domain-containing protein n=1 Tax=Paenibacillus spongiae TaxID=2909671 RepID=A0ABY5SA35_9BACL|nr:PEP/pyruvate-binding domain-containing protein [Paenibacillus spongiae]UVI29583.1 hypothetical protein L1F29_29905 [Paenibacillus spongiae]
MSVVPLEEAFDPLAYGGKAVQLGAALRAGLPVPAGYAISHESAIRIISGDETTIRELITAAGASSMRFAVRSSAVGEDGDYASFAGIYKTVLNIADGDRLLEAVRLIADSGRSPQAIAYQRKQGGSAPAPVGVIVQETIEADCSGVMFTRHPVTGEDERVIEACWGLGESIASGRIIPDLYTVSRGAASISVHIGDKETAIVPDELGGTHEVKLDPSLSRQACLTDEQARQLDGLAAQCEAVFGEALDIEWAYSNHRLYLLQCRKITV